MIDTEGLTDTQKEFLKVFQIHMGNVSEACKAVGVARSTYYRWQESDYSDTWDIFSQAVEDVREGLIDRAESVLYDHLFVENSLDAAKYFLSRKGKKRGYVEKIETDNKSEHTGSVAVICPDKAPMPDNVGNRAES